MKALIKLNLAVFLIYLIATLLIPVDGNVFFIFRLLKTLIELIFIFILGGLNLSTLFQVLFKKEFTFWENISVSSIFSLSIIPLLLSLEYEQINIIRPMYPFINSGVLFLAVAFTYSYSKKKKTMVFCRFDKFLIEIKNIFKAYSRYLPLYLSFFIYVFVIFFVVKAYGSLPDLDPYYWIALLGKQFNDGKITVLFSSRPLFSSLAYVFNQSAHVDLYAYFKYVIPLLYTLVLLPAWMVAEKFNSRIKRFLILLLPLTSASTILYFQTAMPQALIMIFSYHFFFFLIYSWITKNKTFYYLAGMIIFLAYFYQELAAIIFLPWALSLIFHERNLIGKWIIQNKLSSILILLLVFFRLNFILNPLDFLYSWIIKMGSILEVRLNFIFPAFYNNIDGNAMGWGGFWGVMKYYAYYVGPGVILAFLIFIYLMIENSSFKDFIKVEIKKREIQVILFSFLIFFFISEIFPRFFSLALLPERAWIFGGIFSLVFIFFILVFFKSNHKLFCYVLILMFSINTSGAIYINNLKKYIITTGQLKSAEWIKTSLPEKRIFFLNGNRNLISFHSGSKIQTVSDDFYYDIDSYSVKMREYVGSPADKNKAYGNYLEIEKNSLSILEGKDIFLNKEAILEVLNKSSVEIDNLKKIISEDEQQLKNNQALYVYYAKENEKNPYLNRPYNKSKNSNRPFLFDQYPEKFQRIYFDRENEIIIWKIL